MNNDYKVPFTKILDIQPHDNAERLSVATVYGFQVIVQKDRYKIGDRCIYIPIDSILPVNLESIIFPEGSKVKLYHHRVRQIRLRGLASQGMLIDPKDVSSIANPEYFEDEQDLSSILNVCKYEPPSRGNAFTIGGNKQRNKTYEHPDFHKYNGLSNVKWLPDYFKEGEEVVIQCKLHGTNARIGLMPFKTTTLWKKFLAFIKLAPKVERCYGSNNVQKQVKEGKNHFYGEDIWGNTFKSINAFDKIKLGESVFGEIIGPGIQKNYDYGLTEHHFVVFDVKILKEDGKQEWLSPNAVAAYCKERGFEHVPILYKGPYNKELAYSLTKGPSAYNPVQKVREGIVIKSASGYDVEGNKRALKWVSEEYLSDESNSDFH